jgi:uncharacterized protein YdeI (YjbR/CyaY-like superfamily)
VHHQQPDGVWLVRFKAHVTDAYLSWPDTVQELLAFGWVDSLPRKLDDDRVMLWIAPRKAGSGWSAVNKGHVADITAQGLMHPAGQAVIDRARADGSWDALDGVEALEVPPDLAAALATLPKGREIWDAFPRSVRRGALEILLNAKRAETRAAKVQAVLDAIATGNRPFQWRKT